MVHRLIEEGVLEAVRFGKRMVRIPDASYRKFRASLAKERRAS
jgi:hypothetical protein